MTTPHKKAEDEIKPYIGRKDHRDTFTIGRLYRSETEKVIAGVCGGLGEFFHIDPVIPRIFFLIMTVFDGIGILIYLLLWLVIPVKSKRTLDANAAMKENIDEIKSRAKDLVDEVDLPVMNRDNKIWWGILIIVIGLMLLLNNFDFFGTWGFGKFWPALLIVFGVLILGKK